MKTTLPKILLVPALCFVVLAARAEEPAKYEMPTGAVMKPVVPRIAPPPKPIFNVHDYGAKGNGATDDTLAIQKAIDACAGTGGSVLLERGEFVSAPLTLKSGMTFYIAKNCKLLGSSNLEDYPVNIPPNAAGGPFKNVVRRSLITACDVQDLTIDGGGEIDGRGQALLAKGIKGGEWDRPGLIRVLRGKSVAVRQITLRNTCCWTQTYDRCENLAIEKLIVSSPGYVANSDGVNICNCRHAIVRDNYFDTQDDSVCLKSHGRAGMDDVLIENNTIITNGNGIKMGTSSVGDVTNIRAINNTVLAGRRHSALAIQAVDGSNISGFHVSGLTVTCTRHPIFIRLGHRSSYWEFGSRDKSLTGSLDDVLIENVRISAVPDNSFGNSITGIANRMIGKVTLRNIYVEMPGGHDKTPGHPKQNIDGYPEATNLGPLPAYAFYVRHANLVRFENVRCGYLADDVRPWLVSDNAKVETVDCVDLKKVAPLPLPEEIGRLAERTPRTKRCPDGWHRPTQILEAEERVRRDAAERAAAKAEAK